MPLPDKVPFRVILPPLLALGLSPSGRLQSLFTVFVPAVWTNVTKLNVTLLQLIVPLVAPLKLTVPLLWLKVGDPEIVKVEATDVVVELAVNTPAVRL